MVGAVVAAIVLGGAIGQGVAAAAGRRRADAPRTPRSCSSRTSVRARRPRSHRTRPTRPVPTRTPSESDRDRGRARVEHRVERQAGVVPACAAVGHRRGDHDRAGGGIGGGPQPDDTDHRLGRRRPRRRPASGCPRAGRSSSPRTASRSCGDRAATSSPTSRPRRPTMEAHDHRPPQRAGRTSGSRSCEYTTPEAISLPTSAVVEAQTLALPRSDGHPAGRHVPGARASATTSSPRTARASRRSASTSRVRSSEHTRAGRRLQRDAERPRQHHPVTSRRRSPARRGPVALAGRRAGDVDGSRRRVGLDVAPPAVFGDGAVARPAAAGAAARRGADGRGDWTMMVYAVGDTSNVSAADGARTSPQLAALPDADNVNVVVLLDLPERNDPGAPTSTLPGSRPVHDGQAARARRQPVQRDPRPRRDLDGPARRARRLHRGGGGPLPGRQVRARRCSTTAAATPAATSTPGRPAPRR